MPARGTSFRHAVSWQGYIVNHLVDHHKTGAQAPLAGRKVGARLQVATLAVEHYGVVGGAAFVARLR